MLRVIVPCEMTTYERDVYIQSLLQQLDCRQNFLIEKYRQIKKQAEDNEYLENVKQDYQKYFDEMIKQRNNQYLAMKKIEKSLNDLILSETLSDIDLLDATKEQQEILAEIEKIKKKLEVLIHEK